MKKNKNITNFNFFIFWIKKKKFHFKKIKSFQLITHKNNIIVKKFPHASPWTHHLINTTQLSTPQRKYPRNSRESLRRT